MYTATFIKKHYACLVFTFFLLLAPTVWSADYYWVGGTGNWNDMSHWASSSGGSGNAYVAEPGNFDNVFFTTGSGITGSSRTITLSSSYAVRNISFATGGTTVKLVNTNNGSRFDIWGDATFQAGMDFSSFLCKMVFLNDQLNAGIRNIYTNGNVFFGPWKFDQAVVDAQTTHTHTIHGNFVHQSLNMGIEVAFLSSTQDKVVFTGTPQLICPSAYALNIAIADYGLNIKNGEVYFENGFNASAFNFFIEQTGRLYSKVGGTVKGILNSGQVNLNLNNTNPSYSVEYVTRHIATTAANFDFHGAILNITDYLDYGTGIAGPHAITSTGSTINFTATSRYFYMYNYVYNNVNILSSTSNNSFMFYGNVAVATPSFNQFISFRNLWYRGNVITTYKPTHVYYKVHPGLTIQMESTSMSVRTTDTCDITGTCEKPIRLNTAQFEFGAGATVLADHLMTEGTAAAGPSAPYNAGANSRVISGTFTNWTFGTAIPRTLVWVGPVPSNTANQTTYNKWTKSANWRDLAIDPGASTGPGFVGGTPACPPTFQDSVIFPNNSYVLVDSVSYIYSSGVVFSGTGRIYAAANIEWEIYAGLTFSTNTTNDFLGTVHFRSNKTYRSIIHTSNVAFKAGVIFNSINPASSWRLRGKLIALSYDPDCDYGMAAQSALSMRIRSGYLHTGLVACSVDSSSDVEVYGLGTSGGGMYCYNSTITTKGSGSYYRFYWGNSAILDAGTSTFAFDNYVNVAGALQSAYLGHQKKYYNVSLLSSGGVSTQFGQSIGISRDTIVHFYVHPNVFSANLESNNSLANPHSLIRKVTLQSQQFILGTSWASFPNNVMTIDTLLAESTFTNFHNRIRIRSYVKFFPGKNYTFGTVASPTQMDLLGSTPSGHIYNSCFPTTYSYAGATTDFNGTCENYIKIDLGSFNVTSAFPVNAQYLNITNNTVTGATANNANGVLSGTTTGWSITASTPRKLRWKDPSNTANNSANWNNPNYWEQIYPVYAPAPQCPPTKIDTILFDNTSFSANNQAFNIHADMEVASMYWKNVTNAPRMTGTSPRKITLYGSVELSASMVQASTVDVYFRGAPTVAFPTFSIKCNTKRFDGAFFFIGDANTTEWRLLDSTTVYGRIDFSRGRLVTNGFPVKILLNGFRTSPLNTTDTRYLDISNSTIYTNPTAGGYWLINNSGPASNNTLVTAGSTIYVTPLAGTSFLGGGHIYNKVYMRPTSTTCEMMVTNGDQFNLISVSPIVAGGAARIIGGPNLIAKKLITYADNFQLSSTNSVLDTVILMGTSSSLLSSNRIRHQFYVKPGTTFIAGSNQVQWFDNTCPVELIGAGGQNIQMYSSTSNVPAYLRKDSATVCADYIYIKDIWGIGNGNNPASCNSFAASGVNTNCPPIPANSWIISTCDTITDVNSSCGQWTPTAPLRGRAAFTAGGNANNQSGNAGWDYRPYPPVPQLAMTSSNPAICIGDSVPMTISGIGAIPFYMDYTDNLGNTYSVNITSTAQLSSYNAATNAFTYTTYLHPTTSTIYSAGVITIERCFNNTSPTGTGSINVTVNPIPQITNGALTQEICSGTSGSFTATTTVPATVNWTSPLVGGIGGHTTSGTGTVTETLNNSNTSPTNVVYTLTPSAAGCTGTPVQHTITVNPLPALLAGPAQNLDCNTPTATVTVSTAMPGVNYSWSGPSVTGGNTTNSATVDAAGVYTVVVTNPTTTCSANTTVAVNFIPDTQAPTITCPTNITTTTTAGNCSASVAVPNATTADNCGVTRLSWVMTGATTGNSPATGINNLGTQTFNTGTTTVQYTIGDAAGNTTTCSFNVVVGDNIAPTVTCPGNIAANTSLSACSANVNTPNPVTNDNCAVTRLIWSLSGATTGNSPATGINNLGTYTFNQGITTVTYTVFDAAGNSSNCSFQVTVTDNIPPSISCQANVITSTSLSACSASFTTTNPTVSDNCGVTALTWTMTGATTASSPVSGINYVGTYTFNQGTTTVTYTVSDAAGNTSQCSYTITINDNVAPVITCPANSNVFTSSGSCDALVAIPNPVVTDNCNVTTLTWTMSGATTGNSAATGVNYLGSQTFNLGVTTIQYVATDAAGNSSNCSFTVTVTDNVAPVISCPSNIAANTSSSSCDASVVTPNPTVTDNCSLSTLTWSMSGATSGNSAATGINNLGTFTFNSGITTVMYVATDASGNNSNCSFTVTLTDATPPVAPIIDTVFGQCSAVATVPTATDNCSGTITGTTSDPLSYNSQGTFTITWNFTDAAGNTTTVTQIVVVDNTLPPIPPVLPNIYAQCDTTVTAPVSTTNCSGPVTGTTTDPTTYTTQGTYVIVWSFDDGTGNVVTANQNVIIDDTIAPVSQVLPTMTDECAVTLVTPTTTDNCSGTITGTTSDPLTYSTQGTFTVLWTFDDGNGNIDAVTQTVIIADTTDPVTSNCPADISTGTDPGQCTAAVSWNPPTATDNCGVMTTTSTHNPGDVFPTGTTVVTYTFTDAGGNSTTCSFNVTVTENEPPVITGCPSDITVSNDPGTCEAVVAWTAPIATDNCPGVMMTSNYNPGDTLPQGTTTVIYTATDAAGNTATCTFTVTVNDTEAPEITPTEDLIVCEGGTANWMLFGTDNCSTVTFTSTPSSGQVFPVGNTQVIVVGTDAAGNSSSDTFMVVVNPMPNLTVYLDNPDICIGDGLEMTSDNQTAGSNYTWTFDGTPVGSGSSYTISETSPSTNGLYELTIVDQNGCISQGELLVDLSPCDLIIPEALTPNGDGQNDYFAIENLELFPNSSIQIVNRWGNVVFETDDYQNDWDGKSYSQLNVGGNVLPEGTFFYVLTVGGEPEEKLHGKVYTGYVYLKR